jgi:hypothetical protein
MTIELKPEQERVIEQAIEAGLIRSAEDVVDIGIKSVRQQLTTQASEATSLDGDEWAEKLHKWIESHSADAPLLSDEAISRDSI